MGIVKDCRLAKPKAEIALSLLDEALQFDLWVSTARLDTNQLEVETKIFAADAVVNPATNESEAENRLVVSSNGPECIASDPNSLKNWPSGRPTFANVVTSHINRNGMAEAQHFYQAIGELVGILVVAADGHKLLDTGAEKYPAFGSGKIQLKFRTNFREVWSAGEYIPPSYTSS